MGDNEIHVKLAKVCSIYCHLVYFSFDVCRMLISLSWLLCKIMLNLSSWLIKSRVESWKLCIPWSHLRLIILKSFVVNQYYLSLGLMKMNKNGFLNIIQKDCKWILLEYENNVN